MTYSLGQPSNLFDSAYVAYLMLGKPSSTTGVINFYGSGNSFFGQMTNSGFSANRSWILPNGSGTFLLNGDSTILKASILGNNQTVGGSWTFTPRATFSGGVTTTGRDSIIGGSDLYMKYEVSPSKTLLGTQDTNGTRIFWGYTVTPVQSAFYRPTTGISHAFVGYKHRTNGVGVPGLGTGISFWTDDGRNDSVNIATMDAIITDTTKLHWNGQILFRVAQNGNIGSGQQSFAFLSGGEQIINPDMSGGISATSDSAILTLFNGNVGKTIRDKWFLRMRNVNQSDMADFDSSGNLYTNGGNIYSIAGTFNLLDSSTTITAFTNSTTNTLFKSGATNTLNGTSTLTKGIISTVGYVDTLSIGTTGTQASGNCPIYFNLYTNSSARTAFIAKNTGGDFGFRFFSSTSTSGSTAPFYFYTDSSSTHTSKLSILGNGQVGVNIDAPTYQFQVQSGILNAFSISTKNGGTKISGDSTGLLTANGGVTVDSRAKDSSLTGSGLHLFGGAVIAGNATVGGVQQWTSGAAGNYGNATIAAGDSVQVSVTNLTTANGSAMVCYKNTKAASDTAASYLITSAGKLTIFGKFNYVVTWFITHL